MRHFLLVMILFLAFIMPNEILAHEIHKNDYASKAKKYIKYNWQPYKPYPRSMKFFKTETPRQMDFTFYPTPYKKQILTGEGVCVDVTIKDRLTHQYLGTRKHIVYFVDGEIRGHDYQRFWQSPQQWIKASQECQDS